MDHEKNTSGGFVIAEQEENGPFGALILYKC